MLQDLRPLKKELTQLEQIYNLPDWDLYELQDRIVSLEDILNNYLERHHAIDEYLSQQENLQDHPQQIRVEFHQEDQALHHMVERVKCMKREIFGYDTELDGGMNSIYAEHSDPIWEDEPDIIEEEAWQDEEDALQEAYYEDEDLREEFDYDEESDADY